ncbi:MAG TPA: MmcQ/YjbR family DNA-binding protein [candidate division Zixibacteria bacterium]|nr:MmcQ/YjbR family DNA-binding protein [candidate division Zixibacteria bacterium]
MNLETARQFSLALPHATEEIQWGDHLLLKVGGKMFAIFALEPGGPVLSLKTTPERYADLVESEGVTPCSHNMWKYQWVSLERYDAVRDDELRDLLRNSYDLVYAGLPKKKRAELEGSTSVTKRTAKKAAARKSPKKVSGKKPAKKTTKAKATDFMKKAVR